MQLRNKYGPLTAWLERQPREPFQLTFAEIEELLDEALPRSSHLYPAHWHGDAGSRPGRAIRDAGFRVRELDLVEGRVILEAGAQPAKRRGSSSNPALAPPLPAGGLAPEGGSVPDLLREYARLMRTLHDRGVLQTGNSPVSDYAEGLVARAFELERTTGSAQGFDAHDPESGLRVQVKARRFSGRYRNVGMGFIRGLEDDLFDDLVAIVFAEDFSLHVAARMRVSVVRQLAVWVPYVGAHQVRLTRAVLGTTGVEDVTDQLRAAARTWR